MVQTASQPSTFLPIEFSYCLLAPLVKFQGKHFAQGAVAQGKYSPASFLTFRLPRHTQTGSD